MKTFQPPPAASGDQVRATIERLLTQFRSRFIRIAWHYTGNQDAAEDMYGETCLKVLRAAQSGTIRHDNERQLLGYIGTTVVRSALDWRKRQKHVLPIDEQGDALISPNEIENEVLQRLEIDDAKRLTRQIPLINRDVVSLIMFEGGEVEAVASELGITPSAVKSRLVRGRAQLQALLAESAGKSSVWSPTQEKAGRNGCVPPP